MVTWSLEDVRRHRMASLWLSTRPRRRPAEIVEWFGAMQAQDLASGEWSFGVRSAGLTQAEVHRATVEREILRTWPMRGTVHFVPPRDAKWMLGVTGVRALRTAPRRRAELGLTEAIVDRAAHVLREALHGGGCMTRAECVELLVEAGVHTASQHGYHLLWYASQIGVTCIGPQRGKEQTFVLLDEWVPDPVVLDRDEALATLALRYVRSHGPVSRQDFAGWTGLTAGDAARGLELAGDALVAVECEGVALSVAAELLDDPATREAPPLVLLPGFDEFMLGVKDRSAVLAPGDLDRVVPGRNGVFLSTVVSDGRVVGTWKRKIVRHHVDVVVTPFRALRADERHAVASAADDYARYLGTSAHLTIEPVAT